MTASGNLEIPGLVLKRYPGMTASGNLEIPGLVLTHHPGMTAIWGSVYFGCNFSAAELKQ